jgi:biopolymer transport protein ExbD
MRRFSQRNSLVTLSDINITPLMDLAFVLLIIFVIISSSIRPTEEQSMDLNLPRVGGAPRKVDPKDVRTVEISPAGQYRMGGQEMPLEALERELVRSHRANPNMVIYLRVDQNGYNKHTLALWDRCLSNGITRFHVRGQK